MLAAHCTATWAKRDFPNGDHQHGQYTTCQSFDKGFVEFFKKFMGVAVKYYKRLIYGWGIVFWLAGMASLYMGWWGYGGV